MKKTLIALAALAAVGSVSAQAVITGSINMGMAKSATDAYTVGGLKGDRNFLQFAETEDLGNGLKVTGMLNARFVSSTGAEKYYNTTTGTVGDQLFEQTKLTIDSGAGQLAIGRFTNFIGLAPIHFQEDSGFGAANQSIYGRLSSQVQYATPAFSGFQGFVLHAKATDNKYAAALTGNGFTAGVDYSATLNLGTGQYLNDFSAVGVNYANGPVFVHVSSFSGLLNEKSTIWGATYNFGPAKVSLGQYKQGGDIGNTTSKGYLAHTSTEYGVEVPYGNFVGAITYNTNDKDIVIAADAGTSQMTKVGYKLYYSLSKRTTLEFETANVTNGGASSNGTSDNGTSYYTGIRHTF